MNIVRATVIALVGVMVLSIPAFACQRVYDVDAYATFCGDPKADITVINDSTFPVEFKVVYKSGNKSVTPARKVEWPTVAAGDSKTFRRWVRGEVIIRGAEGELLFRAPAISTGPCLR